MKLGSLEKSLHVLEILAAHNYGLALSHLASLSGMPASSVHHILSTMRAHNYIMQDPETKKYSLGYRFLNLSRSILDSFDIRKISRPHLTKLSRKLGESVQLATLTEGEILFVDKVDISNNQLTVRVSVGATLPVHTTASGKVLMLDKTQDEIKRLFMASSNGGKFGPRVITSLEEMYSELENVRKQGYAIDDEESYLGLRALAVPVTRRNKIIATLSVIGPVFNMPLQRLIQDMYPHLRETSDLLSREYHW